MSATLTNPNVLTMEEAAAYLRLPEEIVFLLVTHQGLPGRQIGTEWRFLKAALDDWLRRPSDKEILLRQAGALADDPSLSDLLADIYQRRGRPEVEDD
jgi:excisionase family DNA binding protein